MDENPAAGSESTPEIGITHAVLREMEVSVAEHFGELGEELRRPSAAGAAADRIERLLAEGRRHVR